LKVNAISFTIWVLMGQNSAVFLDLEIFYGFPLKEVTIAGPANLISLHGVYI
jgi:hypothetical protein